MYLPQHFNESDESLILSTIRENSFATLVSTDENGRPFLNHLPIILEGNPKSTKALSLLGHMSRGNPQWKHFQNGSDVQVIFQGPHTYITPSWYVDPLNVPTWNYVVVHISGKPILIHEPIELRSILDQSVEEFERFEKSPWKFNLPTEFVSNLSRGIVGFKLPVTQIEAKFKLSQNRSSEDRAGVIRGLETRSDEMSLKILSLMKR